MAGGQAMALMVTLSDGTQISLLDLLKQADGIPSDATVILGDKTESAADYQAYVHQQVNQILDKFATEMSASVEDLANLASEMYFQSGEISSILSDLQSAMAGIHHACGNDDLAKMFLGGKDGKSGFDAAYTAMCGTNFPALGQSLTNIGDGLQTSSDNLLSTEQATLAGFGRQIADPRHPQGGGRRNQYF